MNNNIDCNPKVNQIETQIIFNELFIFIKGKCCIVKYDNIVIIKKMLNKDNPHQLFININFINKYISDNQSNKINVIDKTINKNRVRCKVNYNNLDIENTETEYGIKWICKYCGDNNIKNKIKQKEHIRKCKKKNIF